MNKLVERIKGQLEYCLACETDLHAHTTATRIAEMIQYHYFICDKEEINDRREKRVSSE